MSQTIPDAYLVTQEDVAKQIGQGDLSLAAQTWRTYPADVASVRRVPHGDDQKMLAENLLYRCYEAAVKLLAATAERSGIDSTAIVQASRDTVNGSPVDEQTIRAAGQTIDRLLLRADMAATEPPRPNPADKPATKPAGKKRDTATMILAALNKHHKYDGTSIFNYEPIGVRELARLASPNSDGGKKVGGGTVSRWFADNFEGGHANYKHHCANGRLLTSLKLLNGDFSPRLTDEAVRETADHDRARDAEFDES